MEKAKANDGSPGEVVAVNKGQLLGHMWADSTSQNTPHRAIHSFREVHTELNCVQRKSGGFHSIGLLLTSDGRNKRKNWGSKRLGELFVLQAGKSKHQELVKSLPHIILLPG